MNRIIYFFAAAALLLGSVGYLIAQSLPPEKQAIDQQYVQERAAGAQNPAPKNPQAPYPIAPEQPFLTGVIDDCSAPFSSTEATILNCWQDLVGNIKTVVYAGAEGDELDPTQGVVYVVVNPGYPAQISGDRVPTPVKGGAVHIFSAQNRILTLGSAIGFYVLTFDVNTMTFTSAVVDKTPPVIAGMPGPRCTLWPPNQKLVRVGTITASDNTMVAPDSFRVTVSSNQPIPPTDPQYPDIVITPISSGAYAVQLRADRLGTEATDRIYTISARARDVVGNVATATSTCTVPHDQAN
jgi:hypothetical protein